MPYVLSRYEPAATTFLERFGVGTTVYASDILGFAEELQDGFAADLLIADEKKRVNSIKRHLNHGAASANRAEPVRYIIETLDPKMGVYKVKRLSEHVGEKARQAFGQSVLGAITPIVRAEKAIDATKLAELEDEAERQALENQREELAASVEPIKKVFSEQISRKMVKELVAIGVPETEAKKLVDQWPGPTATTFTKLRDMTRQRP